METITQWITSINDVLWTYILIIMLLGCAVWFTIKTRRKACRNRNIRRQHGA